MAFGKAGQGATEYLVLMGAVLLIALVAIAILMFMPGTSPDTKISQSAAYWRSEAKPIAITEHQAFANGTVVLVLQNVDAAGTITLTNITVSNTSRVLSLKIGPGEVRTASINGAEEDLTGTMYEFGVTFAYRSPNGLSSVQYGLKPISGKRV